MNGFGLSVSTLSVGTVIGKQGHPSIHSLILTKTLPFLSVSNFYTPYLRSQDPFKNVLRKLLIRSTLFKIIENQRARTQDLHMSNPEENKKK